MAGSGGDAEDVFREKSHAPMLDRVVMSGTREAAEAAFRLLTGACFSGALAKEIAYENDECGLVRVEEEGPFQPWTCPRVSWRAETPAERWQRMRKWVEENLEKEPRTP